MLHFSFPCGTRFIQKKPDYTTRFTEEEKRPEAKAERCFLLKRDPTKHLSYNEFYGIVHEFVILEGAEEYAKVSYLISLDNISAYIKLTVIKKSKDFNDELLALMLFISSGDLFISQVSYMYMAAPSVENFVFMASHGLFPRSGRDIPLYRINQSVIESNGDPIKAMKDSNYLDKMYKVFDWPKKWDDLSEKPMEWSCDDLPLRGEVWACPSAVLQKNLRGIINEWFDCESVV
ncbi:hypothetical protein [Candidatus Sororendozoicomonas aggregata]|uniref:hypothetical protein n=1 Tax=Candidatus Sororendozoicomonas aggregata TaxID=3073239 RepID=UPI002ED6AEC0